MLSTDCRRRTWLGLCVGLVCLPMLSVLGACQPERTITSRDLDTFQQLLSTGLSFEGDPHVRAETLRVLERVGSSALASEHARPRLEDESPMVRVVAVRTLMATGVDDASEVATQQFNQADARERRAILRAVIEYGSRDLKLELIGRMLRPRDPSQPGASAELRRFAFEKGLRPLVERIMASGREAMVRKLFLPKMQRYVRQRDPVLGGPVLKLLLEFGDSQHVQPLVETLADEEAAITARLRAARILTEARAKEAREVFRSIVESAEVNPSDDKLALPEPQTDERLVRAAVLGLVAVGDETYVPRAKRHLEEADAEAYIEVMEALSANPAPEAAVTLKTSMLDARPRVRHRAIELYSHREEAGVDEFLNLLLDEDFSQKSKQTRRTVASALADHFPEGWVEQLDNQLRSAEGIRPALELLKYVSHRTDVSKTLNMPRERLVEIARNKDAPLNTLSAYLLVSLADDPEVAELLQSFDHPMPRYAYLEHVLETKPSPHVDFLKANLYPEVFSLDLFSVRLISGAALWKVHRARYGKNGASSGDASVDEADARTSGDDA